VLTTDTHRGTTSRTVRKVPVLPPAQLANLPERRVVVFRRGMPLIIGRVRMAWTRADVRAATRAATRSATAGTPAAAHTAPGAGDIAPTRAPAAPARVWADAVREDRP